MSRRPFWIWYYSVDVVYTRMCWESVFLVGRLADTTKQALGMLEIHFLNLFLSALISGQECIV